MLTEFVRSSLKAELAELGTIIEDARTAAMPVSGDVRVRAKVETLDESLKDMTEELDKLLNPGAPQRQASEEAEEDFDDAGSTISSSTSVSESIDGRQTPYEQEDAKSQRSTSALDRAVEHPMTPLPRSRTQSLITPVGSRVSQRSASAMLPPRRAPSNGFSMTSRLPTPTSKRKKASLPGHATPTLSTPRTQTSQIRTPSSRLPMRTPSSSTRAFSGSSRRASATISRPKYPVNKKSALDVAVGRIVNNLPVAIDVKHASQVTPAQGLPSRSDDGFKNETGFYWIGRSDREPRKVFCRIMRRSCEYLLYHSAAR